MVDSDKKKKEVAWLFIKLKRKEKKNEKQHNIWLFTGLIIA